MQVQKIACVDEGVMDMVNQLTAEAGVEAQIKFEKEDDMSSKGWF